MWRERRGDVTGQNVSPAVLDAAAGAWALVAAHLDEPDEDRQALLGGDLPADYWRRVADHACEQLAYRLRHEFDDRRASELVERVRRIVLAEAARGGTAAGGSA